MVAVPRQAQQNCQRRPARGHAGKSRRR